VKSARELGLTFGSVCEALVKVLGGSSREAQSVALGAMGDVLGVGLRAELGGEPGVGFVNKGGSIGAELWVIYGEPIALVEPFMRLGRAGSVGVG
jgi:hypothetical protein